ncbi:AMP-binding protein [Pseudofrankia inefficax]|uniref:AMP-dependent synthetase and ligase n=1 Tax=Pseudofrankia inefficax (strain DSM 45817 / CECT 9037 / DDB 130130 / EuI1c) TaxID=298654 RepID=E3J829_PSEI1|nr:AMP-binding protein [Pseudofrankia inefficax]ADP82077.1 AMP-dependent synthetase and ligase [Pseudofrankia inefficax]
MATTTDEAVAGWLATYAAADANVAWLLCDRHDPRAVAFTFVEPDLSSRDLTYGELAEASRRLATGLAGLGVRRGDRVPVLMGKRPELVVTMLALWRLGAVQVPLFTAFQVGAIQTRVDGAKARLVLTEPSQRAKLDTLAGIDVLQTGPEFDDLVTNSPPLAESVAVGGDGAMLQLYTSGTTGKPKGVVVPVRALAAFHCYLHYDLDVRADDVFWNAADPGWAYGIYYGIVGPLAAGRRNLLLNAGFSAESTVGLLRRFGVTNFAAAPTVYRALSKSGLVDGGIALRRASSAGEPLTPDVVSWAREAFGIEVRDHYGQTELGMLIGNHWNDEIAAPLKDSSMGQPLPGYAAGIVDGQIAIEAASSLFWFAGYHEDAGRTAERFTADKRWYLTADTGRVDEDGYFFFTARDDDVILAAGYRIGPFDVESVLITHPAVLDVAVVGRPDPAGVRGEQVEAFVVLAPEIPPSDALAAELTALVRDQYSRHAYPRAVHFIDALPKTPSGKVQRYLLRQR